MEYQKQRRTISSIQEATTELPDYLYHYTSPDAAIGILTHEELWASNISFMNDSSELFYTRKLAKSLIEKRIETEKYHDDTISFLTNLSKLMDSGALIGSCVISFTSLDDSLSQWRAYCPKSGGYAIGFPTALLTDIIAQQAATNQETSIDSTPTRPKKGFKLIQCIYDLQQHEKIINQVIDDCIEEYSHFIGSRAGIHTGYQRAPETPHNFAVDCYNYIQEVALGLKHEGFKEENEWRLVYAFSVDRPYSDPASLLAFRASDKGIMPFMKFSLKISIPPGTQLPYNPRHHISIVIGPCSNAVQRRQSLTFFQISNSSSGTLRYGEIKHSITPYITW